MKIPNLVEKLMAQFRAHPESLLLSYWYVTDTKKVLEDLDARLPIESLTTPCETTACIAGHIALLVPGAKPYLGHGYTVANMFTLPPELKNHEEAHYDGKMAVQDLAVLVWSETYPNANISVFVQGIGNPEYVCRVFGDGERLTIEAVENFLVAASGERPKNLYVEVDHAELEQMAAIANETVWFGADSIELNGLEDGVVAKKDES